MENKTPPDNLNHFKLKGWLAALHATLVLITFLEGIHISSKSH